MWILNRAAGDAKHEFGRGRERQELLAASAPSNGKNVEKEADHDNAAVGSENDDAEAADEQSSLGWQRATLFSSGNVTGHIRINPSM